MSATRSSPITNVITVTPSDTTDIAIPAIATNVARGFQVNVGGNIAVDMVGAGTNVVLAVTAGVFYPYAVQRIRATSTTATGINVFY